MSLQKTFLRVMSAGEHWSVAEIMEAVNCTYVQAKGCASKLRALGFIESTRTGYGNRTALYQITPSGLRHVEVEALPTSKAAIQSRSSLETVWRAMYA